MIPDRLQHRPWLKLTAIPLIVAMFVLSACASTGGTQATATVTGYDSRSGLAWESYVVYKVDGEFVRHGFWGTPADTKITIAPGSHRLDVHVQFVRSLMEGSQSAYMPLTVDLVAGRTYRLQGEITDDKAYVWLVDESSNAYASDKVSWAYSPSRANPTLSPPSAIVPTDEAVK